MSSLNKFLIQKSNAVFQPFFHAVGEDLPHIRPLYKPFSFAAFKEFIEEILINFVPVSLFDLLDNKPLPKNAFHLSFDDGLRSVYDVVFPFLQQKDIQPTIFLNSNFIDNNDLFFRYKAALIIRKLDNNSPFSKEDILKINYNDKSKLDKIGNDLDINFEHFLQHEKPYLTTDQIFELKNAGWGIGGHSMDHPRYTNIGFEQQIHQTIHSCKTIQENFDLDYQVFSFPFSDEGLSPIFFSTIFDQGIDIVFSGRGIGSKHHGKYQSRLAVEHLNLKPAKLIRNSYLKYFIKKKLGKL